MAKANKLSKLNKKPENDGVKKGPMKAKPPKKEDKLKVKSHVSEKLKKKIIENVEKVAVQKKDKKEKIKPVKPVKEVVKKEKKVKKAKKVAQDVEMQEVKVKSAVTPTSGELVSSEVLKTAVEGLKTAIDKTETSGEKKSQNLFSNEVRYGLQVVFVKVPQIPSHTRKILLENTLYGDTNPDVCFIIRDKPKKDSTTAETILEFEEFLTKSGVTSVKTVMPMGQLKQDYGPINMKMKLLNTYDIFLVESEIADHVYAFLGKHFITKRKRPLQIDTKNTDKMKISIEKAVLKVNFKLNSNSNFSVIEVGTHEMENEKIVRNIKSTIEQLKEKWPGGWKNILRLYLKPMAPSKISIPIYYTNQDPNDVEIPVEIGHKQKRRDRIAKQLKTKSQRMRFDSKSKKIVKEFKKPENGKENKGKPQPTKPKEKTQKNVKNTFGKKKGSKKIAK